MNAMLTTPNKIRNVQVKIIVMIFHSNHICVMIYYVSFRLAKTKSVESRETLSVQ